MEGCGRREDHSIFTPENTKGPSAAFGRNPRGGIDRMRDWKKSKASGGPGYQAFWGGG